MAQPSLVFIGIGGNVVALDKSTGQEVWRTALKGRDFVNVVLQDGDLYATNKGELFCLDPATGRIRWQNPLKGLGWGLITIANAPGQQSVVMREKKQRDETAAASAAS
jgi:outer membrane protein assembly factor BamB